MISLLEIRQKSIEWGLRLDVVEKDYVISWLLWGLFQQPKLAESLVFKGGTALRKVYFPSYRFSEDLDFTITAPMAQNELDVSIQNAMRNVQDRSGLTLNLTALRQTRDEEDGDAYEGRIEYMGAIRRRGSNLPRIKIDLSAYELVVLPPEPRPLLHPYSDTLDVQIPSYTLEEVLAEKLRAMLRRTRARDVFDIWFLLKHHRDAVALPAVVQLFDKKRKFKGLPYSSPADFWTPERQEGIAASWEKSIGYQIRDLPPFDEVAKEFPVLISDIFASH